MRARTTLPAEPASAGAARHFVRTTLAKWQLESHVDVACLLVSELVTNAILHASTPSVVSVSFAEGVLRIEVCDYSQAQVTPRSYSQEAGTGRGLMLVSALASHWGSDNTDDGKRVWFELNGALAQAAV
jgi:anti-sigma regulatory factor (Ser/Thr protein kinase)